MVKNICKLRGKITEVYGTFGRFAKDTKLSEATLRKKINNRNSEFTISESLFVKEKLKLNKEEYIEIFFGNELEKEK